jgi:hypothetical protein
MNEKIISYCGIVCTDCPAYIATKNNDDKMRQETAELWSKQYGHAMKPEDINCTGCISDRGSKLAYCAVCVIRTCAKGKKVKNCAYCADYLCAKLGTLLESAPQMKATLDEIKKGLAK